MCLQLNYIFCVEPSSFSRIQATVDAIVEIVIKIAKVIATIIDGFTSNFYYYHLMKYAFNLTE